MAILTFQIIPNISIEFSEVYVSFLRNESQTKTLLIPFINASGQTFSIGQVLYEIGTVGTVGYISVKSTSSVTITDSGFLSVDITIYPSSTEINDAIVFFVDSSAVKISASYNSRPEIEEVVISNIPNRTPIELEESSFISSYSDFDGDQISKIAIFGDVTDFEYYGSPYLAGEFIDIVEVPNILFTPKDQDAYYEQDNTWQAKDINGNLQSGGSAEFKLKVFAKICFEPTLVSVTSSSQNDFELEWSYNGVDYSAESPPMELIIYYSIDGGVNFIQFTTTYPYTETSSTINIPLIVWETIIFKVVVQTRTCFEYSNEITLNV